MKRKLMLVLTNVLLICLAMVFPVMGASFTADFPSATSTVVGSIGFINANEIGYFYSSALGHKVAETFAGTGLHEVHGLHLDFNVTQNAVLAGKQLDWDVKINNVVVGSWSWGTYDGTGQVLKDYLFPSIFSAGGTYNIAMVVTNELPYGFGSMALGFPGSMTLYGCVCPVPIPGALVLLGSGLVGLITLGRRRNES